MNEIGTVTLETDRLILRKFDIKDAEMLHKNWSTDELTHAYDWFFKLDTLEDTKNYINEVIERYNSCPNIYYNWVIEYKENHEVIGHIQVNKYLKNHQVVEIGYSLSSKYFRQGLMTEALTKVVDFLLNEVGVRIIEANANGDNLPSINLLKKVGFSLDAVLPQRLISKKSGKPEDRYMFSIMNKNFK